MAINPKRYVEGDRTKKQIGAVPHLKHIRKKIQYSVRPLFSLEEKVVLSAILTQEIIRRNTLKAYKPQLGKMGINLDELENMNV